MPVAIKPVKLPPTVKALPKMEKVREPEKREPGTCSICGRRTRLLYTCEICGKQFCLNHVMSKNKHIYCVNDMHKA